MLLGWLVPVGESMLVHVRVDLPLCVDCGWMHICVIGLCGWSVDLCERASGFVGAECPELPRAPLVVLTQAAEGGGRHPASGGIWGAGVGFHSKEGHMKGSLQGGALLAQLWALPHFPHRGVGKVLPEAGLTHGTRHH